MQSPNLVHDILERMADDQAFARLVEANPREALDGFDLTPTEISQIEQAVVSVHQPQEEGPSLAAHTN